MNLIEKLKKNHEKSKQEKRVSPFNMLILGSSGSSKSSLVGSLGVPTLFITLKGEAHGYISAITNAKRLGLNQEIVHCNASMNGDKELSDDETLGMLKELLDSDLSKEGFGAVVVDSAVQLYNSILHSGYLKTYCSVDGKYNKWKESEGIMNKFKELITSSFERQTSKGVHCFLTMPSFEKSVEGSDVVEVTPNMPGFANSFHLLQTFGDIVLLQKFTEVDDDGKLIIKYGIVFNSVVTKVSKDQRGTILKSVNFSPRLQGVETLPTIIKADLREILKLKR